MTKLAKGSVHIGIVIVAAGFAIALLIVLIGPRQFSLQSSGTKEATNTDQLPYVEPEEGTHQSVQEIRSGNGIGKLLPPKIEEEEVDELPTADDIVVYGYGASPVRQDSLVYSGYLEHPVQSFIIEFEEGDFVVDVDPIHLTWRAEIPISKIRNGYQTIAFVADFSTDETPHNIQRRNKELNLQFDPQEYQTVPLTVVWNDPTVFKGKEIEAEDEAIRERLTAMINSIERVGVVAGGEFNGYNMYTVRGVCYGMCYGGSNARFLLNPEGSDFVIISSQSITLQYLFEGLEVVGNFGSLNDNQSLTERWDIYIPELEDQDTIALEEGYELESAGRLTTTFFIPWEDRPEPKPIGEAPSGELVYGGSDIFLKRPDNTNAKYKFDIPFYGEDKIPTVTWHTGETNTSSYTTQIPSGCGSTRSYNHIQDLSLPSEGYKAGGITSSGEIVYVYDEAFENEELEKMYNSYGWDGYGRDRKKLDFEVFMNEIPAFFWVNPFGQVVKFTNSRFMPVAECGKPVIYLYPEEEIEAHVAVALMGEMTISVPEHGEHGWDVIAHTDGYVTNIPDGKRYPNLFWEGFGVNYDVPKEGYVIAQEDVDTWLSDTLDTIGFTERERDEFLEFWLPELPESPYVFFTFVDQKYFDQDARLIIYPEPDTVTRVFMEYEALEEWKEVEPLELPQIVREGFTVVEWGGALYH